MTTREQSIEIPVFDSYSWYPSEALYPEEIAEHQFDVEPLRPTQSYYAGAYLEFWVNKETKNRFIACLQVESEAVPNITFHNSDVTYKIFEGAGEINTSEGTSIVFDLNAKDSPLKFIVPRGEPHDYVGRFNALVSWPKGYEKRFMTAGDQRLSKEAAKELRQAKRLETFDLKFDWYTAMLGRAVFASYIHDRQLSEHGL